MDHGKAIGPRHLHVKKHEIGFLLTDKRYRLPAVSRFRDRFDLGLAAEQ
jgi:hypothetical protein